MSYGSCYLKHSKIIYKNFNKYILKFDYLQLSCRGALVVLLFIRNSFKKHVISVLLVLVQLARVREIERHDAIFVLQQQSILSRTQATKQAQLGAVTCFWTYLLIFMWIYIQ